MPKWRNWQTRYIQGVVPVREWRFESSLRHQIPDSPQILAPISRKLGLMSETLHITNGESVGLKEAGLGGEVLFWDDILHEGPVAVFFARPARLCGSRLHFPAPDNVIHCAPQHMDEFGAGKGQHNKIKRAACHCFKVQSDIYLARNHNDVHGL